MAVTADPPGAAPKGTGSAESSHGARESGYGHGRWQPLSLLIFSLDINYPPLDSNIPSCLVTLGLSRPGLSALRQTSSRPAVLAIMHPPAVLSRPLLRVLRLFRVSFYRSSRLFSPHASPPLLSIRFPLARTHPWSSGTVVMICIL